MVMTVGNGGSEGVRQLRTGGEWWWWWWRGGNGAEVVVVMVLMMMMVVIGVMHGPKPTRCIDAPPCNHIISRAVSVPQTPTIAS